MFNWKSVSTNDTDFVYIERADIKTEFGYEVYTKNNVVYYACYFIEFSDMSDFDDCNYTFDSIEKAKEACEKHYTSGKWYK